MDSQCRVLQCHRWRFACINKEEKKGGQCRNIYIFVNDKSSTNYDHTLNGRVPSLLGTFMKGVYSEGKNGYIRMSTRYKATNYNYHQQIHSCKTNLSHTHTHTHTHTAISRKKKVENTKRKKKKESNIFCARTEQKTSRTINETTKKLKNKRIKGANRYYR